jgi:hypothetical protein
MLTCYQYNNKRVLFLINSLRFTHISCDAGLNVCHFIAELLFSTNIFLKDFYFRVVLSRWLEF